MLLAQTLGQVHALKHPGSHVGQEALYGATLSEALAAGQEEVAAESRVGEANGHLFEGHDDDSICRLFDQASHADLAPAVAPLAPVLAKFAHCVRCPCISILPRPGVPFEARGPPAVR